MWLLRVAILVFAWAGVKARYMRYNTTASRDPAKLNVHIISHSHDDAGWLKTVDQYYYGANQSIQQAGVQFIYDTVVLALKQNQDRKFTLAEMAFFSRWWEEQSAETQEDVHKLIEVGQLHVLNGGWVQHDEAAAHYVGMLEQTCRGHRFLKSALGITPRIGWQADPFGHSSTAAALLVGALGLDAVMFGRADYQDVAERRRTKEVEMVWRGAASFGSSADVFTVNLDGYWPLPSFWWEWGNWDDWIFDDPVLEDYNVQQRVDDFVRLCLERFAYTRGNDIIVTMGSDFHYANAFTWYKNLDKLIHYVNLDGRLNTFYSNAEAYVDAKHSYGAAWPLKTDDFFPYADNPHSYWTGYFTSRAAAKGYVRQASSYLQVVRQLEVVAPGAGNGSSDSLWAAVSLTQHHDSITGTAKQHVSNDYMKRVHKGLLEAQGLVNAALAQLIVGRQAQRRVGAGNTAGSQSTTSRSLQQEEGALLGGDEVQLSLSQCPFLNVSVCGRSVRAARLGQGMSVVLWNPLAWPRRHPVALPLTVASPGWTVTDDQGRAVVSQLVPISRRTFQLQQSYLQLGVLDDPLALGDHELLFMADLPPLGYAVYQVAPTAAGNEGVAAVLSAVERHATGSCGARCEAQDCSSLDDIPPCNSTVMLDNGQLQLTFSKETGRLLSVSHGGVVSPVSLDYRWYRSSDGHEGPGPQTNPSGAYIFRPSGAIQQVTPGPVQLETVSGPVLSEVRQTFADWAVLTSRLWQGSEHVELEWTVGPVPVADGVGREVVLHYESGLNSGDEWWTDSNGREMLRRVRNSRPSWNWEATEGVAGNYYPLTAATAIRDTLAQQELTVLLDRAQGGSSLSSGSLELMLHRRIVHDDWRGVGEALNEDECGGHCPQYGLTVRGQHLLLLDSLAEAPRRRRRLQQLLNDPPVLAVGDPLQLPHDTLEGQQVTLRYSAVGAQLQAGLPDNVHLLTLQPLTAGSRQGSGNEERPLLLRLAHLFQVDEDPTYNLSQAVHVDLMQLFGANLQLKSVSELTLSGNQCAKDVQRLQFTAGEPLGTSGAAPAVPDWPPRSPLSCGGLVQDSGHLVVELRPMEIRTFEVAVDLNH